MNLFIQYKSFVKGAKTLVIRLKPLQANFTIRPPLHPLLQTVEPTSKFRGL